MPFQLDALQKVAAALDPIPQRFVFAGACILPMFLDPDFQGEIRATLDVDIVVPVTSYGEWARLRDALVAHGFHERAQIPASRQILFWLGDLPVDFIPAQMPDFGTENHWLATGFRLAQRSQLPDGQNVWHLPVSSWLAAKIAAFEQRGRADVMMSRDLDDIVTLLIGSSTLAVDMSDAPLEVRHYIRSSFSQWRSDPLVWGAMDGYVTSSQLRTTLERSRQALADLA